MQIHKPFLFVGVASALVICVAGFLLYRELQGPSEADLSPLVTSEKGRPFSVNGTRPAERVGSANSSRFVSTAPIAPVAKTDEPQVMVEQPASHLPEEVRAHAPAVSVPSAAPTPIPVVDAAEPSVKAAAPESGSLGRLTVARAELQELKTLVEIEQERSKLRELQNKAVPVPLPAMPVPQLSVPHVQASPARVVAVSGVDGRMVATVQTVKGTRRLHVGDELEGGRVESISREGVNIRTGSRTQMLWFKE